MKKGGSSLLDKTEKDLVLISSFLQKNPSSHQFLSDPTLPLESKLSTITSFLSKIGIDKESIVPNFMGVLTENRRLVMLPKVLEEFEELMKAHRSQVDVTISTASDVPAPYLKNITGIIQKQFIPDTMKPIVKTKVDPSLIGGLLITIGDKTIDLSVATKVNKINKAIQSSV